MSELREAADRIVAGEDPEQVARDYPNITISMCRRSTCDHVWDGPGISFDDGLGHSAICSKCGMAAINDPSIWDDLP